MEWVASTLHTTSERGVSSITTAGAYTSAASSRHWTEAPADLNRLVRFVKRRNLVSARVPTHFNWPLHQLRREADYLTPSSADSKNEYRHNLTPLDGVHRDLLLPIYFFPFWLQKQSLLCHWNSVLEDQWTLTMKKLYRSLRICEPLTVKCLSV